MTHPLAGAEAKVGRSLYHLKTLQEEMPDPSIYAHAITFRQEFDPDAQTITVYFDNIPEISKGWALIAADALQNLRSALNYVAWELAILNLAGMKQNRDPVDDTQFPIADSPVRFPKRYVQDISRSHIAKINDMQPYAPSFMANFKAELAAGIDPEMLARTQHPLAQLRDLTNRVKHKTLRLLFLGTSVQSWALISRPIARFSTARSRLYCSWHQTLSA
jgi:hypothetical protein